MCAGPSVGGAGPGAAAVVHTTGTNFLCTFEIVWCRGHGKLLYDTHLALHERNMGISSMCNAKVAPIS